MRVITLEMSDETYASLEEALCDHYQYKETVLDPEFKATNPPTPQEMIANPESKETFVKGRFVDFGLRMIKQYAIRQNREQVEKKAVDDMKGVSISVK